MNLMRCEKCGNIIDDLSKGCTYCNGEDLAGLTGVSIGAAAVAAYAFASSKNVSEYSTETSNNVFLPDSKGEEFEEIVEENLKDDSKDNLTNSEKDNTDGNISAPGPVVDEPNKPLKICICNVKCVGNSVNINCPVCFKNIKDCTVSDLVDDSLNDTSFNDGIGVSFDPDKFYEICYAMGVITNGKISVSLSSVRNCNSTDGNVDITNVMSNYRTGISSFNNGLSIRETKKVDSKFKGNIFSFDEKSDPYIENPIYEYIFGVGGYLDRVKKQLKDIGDVFYRNGGSPGPGDTDEQGGSSNPGKTNIPEPEIPEEEKHPVPVVPSDSNGENPLVPPTADSGFIPAVPEKDVDKVEDGIYAITGAASAAYTNILGARDGKTNTNTSAVEIDAITGAASAAYINILGATDGKTNTNTAAVEIDAITGAAPAAYTNIVGAIDCKTNTNTSAVAIDAITGAAPVVHTTPNITVEYLEENFPDFCDLYGTDVVFAQYNQLGEEKLKFAQDHMSVWWFYNHELSDLANFDFIEVDGRGICFSDGDVVYTPGGDYYNIPTPEAEAAGKVILGGTAFLLGGVAIAELLPLAGALITDATVTVASTAATKVTATFGTGLFTLFGSATTAFADSGSGVAPVEGSIKIENGPGELVANVSPVELENGALLYKGNDGKLYYWGDDWYEVPYDSYVSYFDTNDESNPIDVPESDVSVSESSFPINKFSDEFKSLDSKVQSDLLTIANKLTPAQLRYVEDNMNLSQLLEYKMVGDLLYGQYNVIAADGREVEPEFKNGNDKTTQFTVPSKNNGNNDEYTVFHSATGGKDLVSSIEKDSSGIIVGISNGNWLRATASQTIIPDKTEIVEAVDANAPKIPAQNGETIAPDAGTLQEVDRDPRGYVVFSDGKGNIYYQDNSGRMFDSSLIPPISLQNVSSSSSSSKGITNPSVGVDTPSSGNSSSDTSGKTPVVGERSGSSIGTKLKTSGAAGKLFNILGCRN